MIDVFIPTTGRRLDLFARALAWWSTLAGEAPELVAPENIHVITLKGHDRQDQDRWRREQAEDSARTKVYVLTDDDIIPDLDRTLMRSTFGTRHGWMLAALEVVHAHPTFGQLGVWLSNEPLEGRAIEDCCERRCGRLADEGVVGGLRFLRKGVVESFPPVEHSRGAYDSAAQVLYKAAGYRSGWLRTIPAWHAGKGRSELWHDWPNEEGDR